MSDTENQQQGHKPAKTFAEAQKQVRSKLKESALNGMFVEFNPKVVGRI